MLYLLMNEERKGESFLRPLELLYSSFSVHLSAEMIHFLHAAAGDTDMISFNPGDVVLMKRL